MPIARGDKDYLIPIKGLNTEANPLNFPQDSCVDCLNVVLDYDPLRIRVRRGLEEEAGGTTGSLSLGGPPLSHDDAYTLYRWDNVNNDSAVSFIVVQHGQKIYFNDATQSNVTTSRKSFYLDLDDVKSGTTEGTLDKAKTTAVQFTNVKGRLLITSRAINPTLVTYTPDADTIAFSELTLKRRDIYGLDDGLGVDERPSTLSESHQYNLLNQGWYQQRKIAAGGAYVDPITNFQSVNGVYPSNADIVYLGMIEDSATGENIFDADALKEQTLGSSPAPKGHYIVDLFTIDRETVRTSPTLPTGVIVTRPITPGTELP